MSATDNSDGSSKNPENSEDEYFDEDKRERRTLEDVDISDEYVRKQYFHILDQYPVTPWSNQKRVTKKVAEAIKEGRDQIIINAPTGSGKSLINASFIKAVGNKKRAVYCTPQNTLLDQLAEDENIPDNFYSIRGRGNYECNVAKNNDTITLKDGTEVGIEEASVSADKSPSIRFSRFPHNSNAHIDGYGACCNYRRIVEGQNRKETACEYAQRMYQVHQVLDARSNGNVMTNFDFYLSSSMFRKNPITDEEREVDLLVIDEADKIEDVAFNQATFSVGQGLTGSLDINIIDDMNKREFYEWMNGEFLRAVSKRIQTIQDSKESKSIDEMEELNQLKRAKQSVEVLNIITNDGTDLNNIILDYNEYGGYTVRPVKVARYLQKMVFDHANIVILSSATINQHFLKSIGVDDSNTKFINCQDRRPEERRRVYFWDKADMTTERYAEHDSGIPQDRIDETVKGIRDIADEFENEAGIVHCYSYALLDEIKDQLHLSHPDRIIDQRKQDDPDMSKQDAVDEYIEKAENGEAPILLGVGNERGLDLEHDLGRFNIITKVPYPPVDERTRQREQKWYYIRCCSKLAQATGRTSRQPDDWSSTFILDKSFKRLWSRWRGLFPSWFTVTPIDHIDEVNDQINELRQEAE